MVTLSDGTTTLTLNHVLWPNRSRNRVAGYDRSTLGGRLVSLRLPLGGGEIRLEARRDDGLRGWFTWSQVEQLMSWRDNSTPLTLVYDGESRSCLIPVGGIDIEPVLSYSRAILADAKCAGTLLLKER